MLRIIPVVAKNLVPHPITAVALTANTPTDVIKAPFDSDGKPLANSTIPPDATIAILEIQNIGSNNVFIANGFDCEPGAGNVSSLLLPGGVVAIQGFMRISACAVGGDSIVAVNCLKRVPAASNNQ